MDEDTNTQEQEDDVKIDIHYEEHQVVDYIDGYEKIWKYEG